MNRRTLALLVVATVVVSSVATWFANERIQSPAEAAARTAPPTPSPILVRVEQRVLTTRIVSRGTGHYGSPRELVVAPSALKDGPQVVTKRPSVGAVIDEGDVLMTISGRPILVLEGAQPSYRDLGPGMSGPDVRQLEAALKRSGIDPGSVDGRYDQATGSGVARLYARHGFRPVVATSGQLAAVRPTEAELVAGARASGGVQLPADEVVFVRGTPLRVAKAGVGLGVAPDLPVDQAQLVKVGAEVLLDEPALGIKANGRVSHVAPRPGTGGADQFHVFFRVVVPDPPPALVGTSVRLTVPFKSTRKAQLVVPLSAVSLGPDGASRVQRSDGGTLRFVPVEPGLSADGYVAVTPDGPLAVGDLVVVGFEQAGGQGGGAGG
jgi:peptidoglycan hydrolase-like protein with peptidoglycan-binding domain